MENYPINNSPLIIKKETKYFGDELLKDLFLYYHRNVLIVFQPKAQNLIKFLDKIKNQLLPFFSKNLKNLVNKISL